MKKGKFVIISGPSGVGKDTICDELVKKGMGRYSVSMTTRKKRSNEIEGISYFFVSKEEFENYNDITNIKPGDKVIIPKSSEQ